MNKVMSLRHIALILFPALLAIFIALSHTSWAAAQELDHERFGLPPARLCDTIGRPGSPYAVGINCRIMLIDMFPRTYIVYIPSSWQPNAPVVFIYHGTNGDGDGYLRKSGWVEVSDREGIVLVSASGLKYCPLDENCSSTDLSEWVSKWHHYHLERDVHTGPQWRMPGYPHLGAQFPPDDVAFTELVMDDVEASGYVDPSRFYASGFSSGAAFSARLAMEIPDRLAAAAYSSAGIISESVYLSTALDDIPVLALIGTHEPGIMVHANEQPLPLDPNDFLALGDLMDYYVIPHLDAFNHSYDPLNLSPVTLEGSQHTLYRWQDGTSEQLFQLGVVEGLTHTTPAGCGPGNPLGWLAPEYYWEFFQSDSSDPISEITHGGSCP